jgi:hypothetical protein
MAEVELESLAKAIGIRRYEILRHLRAIQVLWRDAESRYLAVPHMYRPAFGTILAALGFPETIYTQVPARAAPA